MRWEMQKTFNEDAYFPSNKMNLGNVFGLHILLGLLWSLTVGFSKKG